MRLTSNTLHFATTATQNRVANNFEGLTNASAMFTLENILKNVSQVIIQSSKLTDIAGASASLALARREQRVQGPAVDLLTNLVPQA